MVKYVSLERFLAHLIALRTIHPAIFSDDEKIRAVAALHR